MPTITAILAQPRKRTLELYIDGEWAFTVGKKLVAAELLFVGKVLLDGQVDELTSKEEQRVAIEAAYRYLAYGPRSEKDMRTRLRRKGVLPKTLELTMEKLRAQRLLNDAEYAQQYVERRNETSPRGQRMLTWELRQKGIGTELAEHAVEDQDDEGGAYRAAERRAGRLQTQDYREFRKRIGDFLLRRGFGYAVVERTVSRLWRERPEQVSSDFDEDAASELQVQ